MDPLLHSHLNQIKQQTAAHTEHLHKAKEHHSDSLKAIQAALTHSQTLMELVLGLQMVVFAATLLLLLLK